MTRTQRLEVTREPSDTADEPDFKCTQTSLSRGTTTSTRDAAGDNTLAQRVTKHLKVVTYNIVNSDPLRSPGAPSHTYIFAEPRGRSWRAKELSLFGRFETKLEQHNGNLPRAVVELAKDWRTDKILRHLEALLLVADTKNTYILSGNGDVIEPDEDAAAIGSGGPIALAAATALMRHTKHNARLIAEEAMAIAAHTCIYTNDKIIYEELS